MGDEEERSPGLGGEERHLLVGPEAEGDRLDRWLARAFPGSSRTRIQTWIRQGRVTVDGRPARMSLAVAAGQQVTVLVPEPPPAVLEGREFPLNVLFEDEHLMVVLKPAGLQVHPGAGAERTTLAHALLHRDPTWNAPGPPERPGIVHRLDRDTSGLMLVARSSLAYQALIRMISAREVTRRYVALVWGSPTADSGSCDLPIGRDRRDRRRMAVVRAGRPALTHWRVLHRFDSLSILDLVLATGRTHQIRVHLSRLGHPVFGDQVYGGTRAALERVGGPSRPALAGWLRRLNRQALHAYHLAFRHPVAKGQMRFEAPVPADMDAILKELLEQEEAA